MAYNREDYDPVSTFDHEQVVVGATPASLSASLYDVPQGGGPAKLALIQVLDAAIYFTLDGTTPSSTNGQVVEPSTDPRSLVVVWGSPDIRNFRALRRDAADAKLNVRYSR